MDDLHVDVLRHLAAAFRGAIERARAERAPGALPYFPEGACRITSRLFARHLARRPDVAAFGRLQLVSGVVSSSEPAARHYWLEVGGAVVDLTADSFGEASVVVGSRTPFHLSLSSPVAEDAPDSFASVSPDEAVRLARQLAAIEARLPGFSSVA